MDDVHKARLYRLNPSDAPDGQWSCVGGVCDVCVTAGDVERTVSVREEGMAACTLSFVFEPGHVSPDEGNTYINFTAEGVRYSLSLAGSTLTNALRRLVAEQSGQPSRTLDNGGTLGSDSATSDGFNGSDSPFAAALEAPVPVVAVEAVCRSLLRKGRRDDSRDASMSTEGMGDTGEGHEALAVALSGMTDGGSGRRVPYIAHVAACLDSALSSGDPTMVAAASRTAWLCMEACSVDSSDALFEAVTSDAVFSPLIKGMRSFVQPEVAASAPDKSELFGAMFSHLAPIDAMSDAMRVPLEGTLRVAALQETIGAVDGDVFGRQVLDGPFTVMWSATLESYCKRVLMPRLLGSALGAPADGFWLKTGRVFTQSGAAVERARTRGAVHAETVAGDKSATPSLEELQAWLQLVEMLCAQTSATNASSHRTLLCSRLSAAHVLDVLDAALRAPLRLEAPGTSSAVDSAAPAGAVAEDLASLEAQAWQVLNCLVELDGGPALLRRDVTACRQRPVVAPQVISAIPDGESDGSTPLTTCERRCRSALSLVASSSSPSLLLTLVGHILLSDEDKSEAASDFIKALLTVMQDSPEDRSLSASLQFALSGGPAAAPDAQVFLDIVVASYTPLLLLPFSDSVLPEVNNLGTSAASAVLKQELGGFVKNPTKMAHLGRSRRLEVAELLAPGTRASQPLLGPRHTRILELLTMLQSSVPLRMRAIHNRYQSHRLLCKGLRSANGLLCLAAATWLRTVLAPSEPLLAMELFEAGMHAGLAAALLVHGGDNGMVAVSLSALLVDSSPLAQPARALFPDMARRYGEVAQQCARIVVRGHAMMLMADSGDREMGSHGGIASLSRTPTMRAALLPSGFSPQVMFGGQGRGLFAELSGARRLGAARAAGGLHVGILDRPLGGGDMGVSAGMPGDADTSERGGERDEGGPGTLGAGGERDEFSWSETP